MFWVSFIIAILAGACFTVSYIQTKAIVSLGLSLLVTAWVIQLVHPVVDITIK